MVLSSDKPLRVPVLYVRDKTFFRYNKGIKIFLGGGFGIIRSYQKRYKLVHLIDENLLNGNSRNLDIYNQATYHLHIQVEIDKIDDQVLKTLLSYDTRIVSKNKDIIQKVLSIKPRYIVLKKERFEGNEKVRDLIIEKPDKEIDKIKNTENENDPRTSDHRIFVYKKEYDKLPNELKPYIFGVLF